MSENQPLIAYEEPDVLSRQQINQCLMDIDDLHPLRDRVRKHHILPCLKAFNKNNEHTFEFQLRGAILEDMDIKMPKSDKEIEADPFLLLGFGVNSYFDVMLELMKMNLMITIFILPIFYCYSHNAQLGLKPMSGGKYAIEQFSLGNMGGAHVKCVPKAAVFSSVIMSCATGRIDTENTIFGVMSS